MKVNGPVIKRMVKESSGTRTAIIMKDFGWTIRHMVRDFIHQPMAQVTSVIGKMICSMGLVKKLGLTSLRLRVSTIRAVSKAKGSIDMQMGLCMMETGSTIKSMA